MHISYKKGNEFSIDYFRMEFPIGYNENMRKW